MKEVWRCVGWTVLIFSAILIYGSRNTADGIITFILVGMLVSSVFMLIYGYRDYGIKAVRIEKDIIVINNVAYPPSSFEMVNGLIKGGRTERAVKELQWLINVSETEAHDIVQKWDEYCG